MTYEHLPCGLVFCFLHKPKHESKKNEWIESTNKCVVCNMILQCGSHPPTFNPSGTVVQDGKVTICNKQ